MLPQSFLLRTKYDTAEKNEKLAKVNKKQAVTLRSVRRFNDIAATPLCAMKSTHY